MSIKSGVCVSVCRYQGQALIDGIRMVCRPTFPSCFWGYFRNPRDTPRIGDLRRYTSRHEANPSAARYRIRHRDCAGDRSNASSARFVALILISGKLLAVPFHDRGNASPEFLWRSRVFGLITLSVITFLVLPAGKVPRNVVSG